ncbi:DUF3289 family protein [Vibrio spartinae]|uniref:DUF3289 family protein n=1 Tax=Vibrio spartinae TaxID=1918945 RepID=A0A1N6LZV6_9VIBR|nr:DUF3289 family protein [Vibrio spartinae]SIO92692.1 hypothetical protein VSP9026_00310 [Vibrio spartinae]
MSSKGPQPYGVNGSRYGAIDHTAIKEREQRKLELLQQRSQAHNDTLERIEKNTKSSKQKDWLPVSGSFPRLVYETENKMDTFYNPKDPDAPSPNDMKYGDKKREEIESYGHWQPFRNKTRYSPSRGYDIVVEDQFTLPAKEHFNRMRSLGGGVVSFSMLGKTKDIFSTMVDKFERNEGGYYMHPLLDNALREHQTTAIFHTALKKCLGENIKDGVLDKDIVNIASNYMKSSSGARLPQFKPLTSDLFNGTVLTVHGIWSMRVYAEKLEYKEDQIKGIFKYEVQDHFGLDVNDINHKNLDKDNIPFEKLGGFRSWFLLQHYIGYSYQPFITKIGFKL